VGADRRGDPAPRCGGGHPARARRAQGVDVVAVLGAPRIGPVRSGRLADGRAFGHRYDGYAQPTPLDLAGIDRIVAAFGAAARRAVEAGFQVLEVHAAHGYLLHEFLSPLSNQRDDEYGGSLENRARLLLRVLDAVTDAAPSVPLIVRFSATDWASGGWDAEHTVQVARWAAEHGADFFDISSGGLVAHQQLTTGPGYQVELAARVRREAGVPVNAVGMIDDAAHAERVVAEGAADAVMAGREWLRDPHYALRAATELGAEIDYWPAQYLRARPVAAQGG
jgi:2,4-dienoyl-CoA reductase-like NADH-dependent reductase (Old Yellow Enzyme family)